MNLSALNFDHFPDRMTHEEAADLFMTTMAGQQSGVNREQFLVLLRARFPTEDALNEFFTAAKALLAGATIKPAWPARRYFEYTIGGNGSNITCNTCGWTSHNVDDVRHRYCGNCKKFHD